jgi:Met-10+ like-protein
MKDWSHCSNLKMLLRTFLLEWVHSLYLLERKDVPFWPTTSIPKVLSSSPSTQRTTGCALWLYCLNALSESLQVTDTVRVFCEDGREFIKTSIQRASSQPFPAYTGPRQSRVQEEKERRRLQKQQVEAQIPPPPPPVPSDRRRISHFVMNLPDSAIQFLDAFRGILADADPSLRDLYQTMPMVHCHCFTREVDEVARAEADIRQVSGLLFSDWLLG